MSDLKNRIQQRLTALGISESGASVRAGQSRSFLRNVREGKSNFPRADKLAAVARVLNTTPEWLLDEVGAETLIPDDQFIGNGGQIRGEPDNFIRSEGNDRPNAKIKEPIVSAGPYVPVYGQAVGGVDGEFLMNGNLLYEVMAPPALTHVRGAYGVQIVGDSMWPRYQDGEIAFIDPTRRVIKGDYVIAQIRLEEEGPILAYVKQFQRHNSSELVLSQFNPEKDLRFKHEHVVSVHKIIMAGEELMSRR